MSDLRWQNFVTLLGGAAVVAAGGAGAVARADATDRRIAAG
jgi:hypothetical protein